MSVDVQQLCKGSKVHIDAAVTACFPEEFRSKSDTLFVQNGNNEKSYI